MTMKDDLAGYEIYDPIKYPEHFADPAILDRTLTSALSVRELQIELEKSYRDEQSNNGSVQTSLGLGPDQLTLIERLEDYSSNPLLAYAIVRFCFYGKGGYSMGGVPQVTRDRTLRSVLDKTPLPATIRKIEKELLNCGFLTVPVGTKRGDNLLAIAPRREINSEDVRQLLVALTDSATYPAQIARLHVPED
jgi:hypothetical protein